VFGRDVPPRRLIAAALVLASVLAGCSKGGSGRVKSNGASSPFSVEGVPRDYQLVSAGTGTQGQAWGADEFGTQEPFTVLAPVGADAESPAAIIVSVTGYEGLEDGLDGTVAARRDEVERFIIDGREALYAPARTIRGVPFWADLVAIRGVNWAVRVTARDASKAQLLDVLRRTRRTTDHLGAPVVADPPAGLHVVGSVDADVIVGLNPKVELFRDDVPGSNRAHGAGWLRRPRGGVELAVMTLPGTAADLDALAGYARFASSPEEIDVQMREVGGRTVAVMRTEVLPSHPHAVFTKTADGNLVMLVASGQERPAEAVLVELAMSVQRADDDEWERFVVEAAGGPGLHADAGAVELARGHAGTVEWLFQAVPSGRDEMFLPVVEIPDEPGPVDPSTVLVADPCLKLSNRRRACAWAGGGSSEERVQFTGDADASDRVEADLPEFMVVTTNKPGSRLRVQNDQGTYTGKLYRPSDAEVWVALVFVDEPGIAICREGLTIPSGVDVTRVDVLDSRGRPTACVGG
jgi:hypothetical protein